MRVFVTGASGFVGANIVHRLLTEGHEVYISLRKDSNTWRLNDIISNLNVCYDMDLLDFTTFSSNLVKINPQAIIHLATYGAYPTVQTDMMKIVETNYLGTINLIRAAQQTKYEIFINTSSSSEYGLTDRCMSESDFPVPINYYGATKSAVTIFCQTHTRITGAPIVTTRLFSVYGPYEEPLRLIPSTIKKCLTGEVLKFTEGKQCRDFIYIRDVEDAYLALLKRADLKGEIFNIGTGLQTSVSAMVETILNETRPISKPKWGVLPTRERETFNWVADMEKTSRTLNWKFKYSVADGIKETVQWMRGHLSFYL